MVKKFKTDSKITVSRKNVWKFDKQVTKNFEEHILRSVPGYFNGHDLIISIAKDILDNNSKILDLGCSTGTLLRKIKENLNIDVKLYGIDISKDMISKANKINKSNNLKFYNTDITKLKEKNFNLIFSYYTLQFIHSSKKIEFLEKVYEKLNENCYFIVFEKIIEKSGFMQNLTSMAYNDFKVNNNFQPYEIFNKTHTLRGAMHSITQQDNYKNFKICKFKDINLIFKNLFFEGYIMKK